LRVDRELEPIEPVGNLARTPQVTDASQAEFPLDEARSEKP
jgi:hypothetical protein